jgi:hypothetical protein
LDIIINDFQKNEKTHARDRELPSSFQIVFASVAPITKHYFDDRPINEELRSTIWLKGTQCRVVH